MSIFLFAANLLAALTMAYGALMMQFYFGRRGYSTLFATIFVCSFVTALFALADALIGSPLATAGINITMR